MATKKRRRRTRKAKGKVRVKQSMQLKQKTDTTANDTLNKVRGRLPADAGANFKVTIKKKKKH